ncbi:MAG TPA: phytanoyl-CoA dioxygenase family protein [Cytophagaceae bacterium]|nr:phytanoyl-CoA dioxygenase family protein [Cytophagaceae bacterium]
MTANLPWVESPFFYQLLEKKKNLTEEQRAMAIEYHERGYIVLKNFFDKSFIDEVRKQVQEEGFGGKKLKTFQNDVRVQDLWTVSPLVQKLASDERALKILEFLYEREPIPFQTLNFKVGTQQRAHSDTIHFSSLPARYMCGIWVPLEDVTENNGPLFYYPGSHKTPEYNFTHVNHNLADPSYDNYGEYETFMENLMEVSGYKKEYFLAKKGDALVWSSNIIHGGSGIKEKGTTRWSQVTHYFFKDTIYYTPMMSNMVTGNLYARKELIDIKTGKLVEQTYNGDPVKFIQTDFENHNLVLGEKDMKEKNYTGVNSRSIIDRVKGKLKKMLNVSKK